MPSSSSSTRDERVGFSPRTPMFGRSPSTLLLADVDAGRLPEHVSRRGVARVLEEREIEHVDRSRDPPRGLGAGDDPLGHDPDRLGDARQSPA
jgi:hypothetical protein